MHRALLTLAPIMFLLLWAGGYAVAKIALAYSPPMALLGCKTHSNNGPQKRLLDAVVAE